MTSADTKMLRINGPQLKPVYDAVVNDYDPADLKRDLYFRLGQDLSLIAEPGTHPAVVSDVLRTADRKGWLRELLEMFCASDYPAVRNAATNTLAAYSIQAETGKAPAAEFSDTSTMDDPYLCHLISQQPFIDRSELRANLRDLLSESISRVLAITGDRPCGKSYTWFFINQPELLTDIKPALVDLSEWSEPTTPVEVMSSIASQLGLAEPRIDEHAQEAAQALRLRNWLTGRLREHDSHGRWLLVFDSLDHVGQREETLQLIEFLAGAAIRRQPAGLRVVLLGYANRLAIDPLESVLTESIRDIGEPELRDFFRLLAQRANMALSEDAISVTARSVLSLLPPERASKLRQLPRTVRAVGNAALGQEVLP
jgi:hypothetical protein